MPTYSDHRLEYVLRLIYDGPIVSEVDFWFLDGFVIDYLEEVSTLAFPSGAGW
jgi:hypothetical protein